MHLMITHWIFDRLFMIVSHALTKAQQYADVFILKEESDVFLAFFSPSLQITFESLIGVKFQKKYFPVGNLFL